MGESILGVKEISPHDLHSGPFSSLFDDVRRLFS